MKKVALACILIALVVSCKTEKKSEVGKLSDEYALVKVPTPDLSGISDNGKEVLSLYKFAADQADSIYWLQTFGDKNLMAGIADPDIREFAMINYGPWDRVTGKSFVEGYGERPLGAAFYPQDMTKEEFRTFDDSTKTSPYTMIVRDDNGQLKSVWYHDMFKPYIDKICSELQAAADITIKPSVRNYLLKKIDALKSDDYLDADKAWLDVKDSKMDLIIGPSEINDDQLFGLKASYDAYVLLKDEKRTEQMSQLTSMFSEMQTMLPCDDEYKTFVPGNDSEIYTFDAIYLAGHANAGIKLMALNLPTDPYSQQLGTRSVLLHNIMVEKFNRVVNQVGMVVLNSDQQAHLSEEAFYWTIAFREIAHGLGVKETINGKGSVNDALGNKALTWEDAKANVVGLYLLCKLLDDHKIPGLTTKEDAITTFFANLVRSQRFGEVSQLGRAYVMVFNYLNENGAFKRGDSGKYSIDYDKTMALVSDLAGIILKTQATGDYEFATQFEDKYCSLSEDFKADLMNIRLENIPVDLKFEFEK
jgi:hypothetical protein